jgi:four helix bundle protein
MTTFSRFEDIKVWQKARNLSKEIYEITSDGRFAKDFDLRSQIRRSCVSIMANIAEGQGRRSDKEFANFLNISLGSIAETKSHIYLALDLGYLDRAAFDTIYENLDEVGRMTFALCKHLRSPATSTISEFSKTS